VKHSSSPGLAETTGGLCGAPDASVVPTTAWLRPLSRKLLARSLWGTALNTLKYDLPNIEMPKAFREMAEKASVSLVVRH
jgi:hypothetical protein